MDRGTGAGRTAHSGRIGSAARLFAAFVLALFMGALPAAAQDFSFSNVRIEGNQRIEPGTILSYAEIPRGETLNAAELNDAYQRVIQSGLFETVEFAPQGGTLVIRVVERPTINVINIEGNRRIDDEQLLPLLESRPRQVFSPTVAERDAAAIASAYEAGGRFAATVTPRIIRRSDNRIDLVFEVAEGRVVEVERISFVGNRAFSDSRLRRVLETKQAGFLRQIIQRDTFVAERLELDQQLLRDFYLSRGFVDFRILDVTTEFSRERNATFITFTVQEGPRYDFGEITASTDLGGIDPQEFLRESRIRQGQTYTPTLIENTITRMELLALDKGFDFVRVEPQVTRDDRNLELDVDFRITRGPRVFVERIDIEGNQTTLDRVIRREFRVAEGDPFNPREIRRAAERIRALGFFSDVDVQTRPGSSQEQVVVDVNVEEQPTGSFGFGGSFSIGSGFGLVITFSETNFLGRGQTLRFDLNTTSDNREASLTFIEPAFLGRDLTFGLNAFLNTSDNDNSNFSTRVIGVRPYFEFPIGDASRLQVRYSLSQDDIFDVSPDSSPILQAEEGDLFTSALGYTYSYDTRRVGIDPNTGILLSFGQDFAGLGGDNRYIETTARALAQRTVLNEEVTLRAIFEGGALAMIDGNSRVTDRFFLSSNQLRGFEFRGLGPRDLGVPNEDALGGNYYAVARFEADFPLGLPEEYGVTGGVFLDVGSLWGLDNTAGAAGPVDDSANIRSSVGFSLFWTTPIGPLTFNFSRILQKEVYDEEQLFDFTITTRF